jgi:hypothetical protein
MGTGFTVESVRENGNLVAVLQDTDGDPLRAEVWDVDGEIVIIYVVGRHAYVFVDSATAGE